MFVFLIVVAIILAIVNIFHLMTFGQEWMDDLAYEETFNPFHEVKEVRIGDLMKVFVLPSYIVAYLLYVLLVAAIYSVEFVSKSPLWNKKLISFKKKKED